MTTVIQHKSASSAIPKSNTNPQRKQPVVVLIGHFNSTGTPETKGSGFAAYHLGRKYIVTCRHTIETIDPSKAIAIPSPRLRVFPTARTEYLELSKPIFHPADTNAQSHDVVVFDVTTDISTSETGFENALRLEDFELNLADPGEAVQIRGFSVPYLARRFDQVSESYLEPETTEATLSEAPLYLLTVDRFTRALGDLCFLATESGLSVSDGTSGAPVLRVVDRKCVGMVIASVHARKEFPDGRVVPIRGGAFVPSVRVRETLEYAAFAG